MAGKVYLVGAGPGDPDLLTVKAARVLNEADVVLHDDLVSADVLALVPEGVVVRNVGKRCGHKRITQTELNDLMVAQALAGMRVVRLKSGDPLLFSRACEEIGALQREAVEYEIIPGITSGLGAASAIEVSLTSRGVSSAVVLMTAHNASERPPDEWRNLVTSGATLVIYMPGDRRRLADRLVAAGVDADTPCAVVANATTAIQKTMFTTVGALPNVLAAESPAVVIVGRVVSQGMIPLVARQAQEHYDVAASLVVATTSDSEAKRY